VAPCHVLGENLEALEDASDLLFQDGDIVSHSQPRLFDINAEVHAISRTPVTPECLSRGSRMRCLDSRLRCAGMTFVIRMYFEMSSRNLVLIHRTPGGQRVGENSQTLEDEGHFFK
jgi:hypothetical protein